MSIACSHRVRPRLSRIVQHALADVEVEFRGQRQVQPLVRRQHDGVHDVQRVEAVLLGREREDALEGLCQIRGDADLGRRPFHGPIELIPAAEQIDVEFDVAGRANTRGQHQHKQKNNQDSQHLRFSALIRVHTKVPSNLYPNTQIIRQPLDAGKHQRREHQHRPQRHVGPLDGPFLGRDSHTGETDLLLRLDPAFLGVQQVDRVELLRLLRNFDPVDADAPLYPGNELPRSGRDSTRPWRHPAA